MLFNSLEFLFAFLPLVLLVFWWLCQTNQRLVAGWLIIASLVFYGWETPCFLLILLASVILNFLISFAMEPCKVGGWIRRSLLFAGVTLNLCLIGYFKYACFLIENLNSVFETGLTAQKFILPIGISFYTFQQISFLVRRFSNAIHHCRFFDYCLFVTFFPQLIAGPIVDPREMLPQISNGAMFRWRSDDLAVGFTIFFTGLFKKTIIADALIPFSSSVFADIDRGADSNLVEAWCAALAFTLQLYFDFSGYSDMALGLGRLFGIRLPLNFNSPYQAESIIDFWRRWHMSLSRFLKDHVYIPLGGSRVGPAHRCLNLMVTMLLGGLWHGASWTFVLWGGLHGACLIINHAWRAIKCRIGDAPASRQLWAAFVSRGVTFLAVVCGWVLFRATTVRSAVTMFESMLGMNGIVLPRKWLTSAENSFGQMTMLQSIGVRFEEMPSFRGWNEILPIIALLSIVWLAPNTQQIMGERTLAERPVPDLKRNDRLVWAAWKPNPMWAVMTSLMTVLAILQLSRTTEFLYFQF